MEQHFQEFPEITEWLKQQPLSILQLDAADRIVLFIADERDAIQKKTFTKWVNKHLIKVTKGVVDLFEDLRDGSNLISLLEVLSGEMLPRERGRMRVHMLQNVQIALNFLKHRKIKLVNIRAEDIVDGNPKLTLGLIWTIILHFQLSDIVQHDDTLSFREALLRWAQKTTEGYPGVKVTDFTQSWRDGLAFNAILHRNRPDLLDYRSCRGRTARDNLENAFHIADKDLGVTRLLDPEDVDIPQPDEKSLITYISSLYELFPEPPEHNPLMDIERIRRIDEYKDLASRLCVWMRESTARLRERNFPNTLQDMKIVQQENNRFRTEEIPPKLHDKQRLASSYKDVLKMTRSLPGNHVRIEDEYKIENIEHQWNKLITAHQERDHAISEELNRLEKLHRLAEKLLRDIKQCDTKLDDIERKIVEEEKRVQRLHPLDAKFNIDQIEAELRQEEERIKSMFKDVQTLREGRYHKATELHNRVQQLHQRWADMKLDFQTRVVQVLADRRAEALKKPLTEEDLINSNPSFKFLHECILWVQEKLKKLEGLDFGHDLESVKSMLEQQKVEHRSIDQFQSKVDQCDAKKSQFKGEEYDVYTRMLNRLHKGYSELLVMSNKRLSDLDTLLDFVQSASSELKWLADKEEVEVSRDWSSRNINVVEVEQYHRQLIVELERREHQFNSVQDRGESLIRQRHPATKCIEGLMARMQSQWSWLLQLINCLEAHLKNAGDGQQFFNESRECDQWLTRTEDKLNTTYSKQNFSIEEGEQLLKEMNHLKDDITRYGHIVSELVTKSKDVVPAKQRKAALPRPIKVRSVCMVKQGSSTVTKNESVTLHDNSQRAKWRIITSSGSELNVPGVCFVIPPPDQEAIDTANELKKKYEALVALWARKQHKLRQNMIFATLKIVKGWDYPTYCAMDPKQRNSIIKALDDDIDKLAREGPPDDSGSKRLRDEMNALKKKFAEFDARLRAEEDAKSNKTLTKKYTDAASNILEKLIEKERILIQRAHNPLPRERETLETLVLEHKEFENDVKAYEPQIQQLKELFHNIPQKTQAVQGNYDSILETWNRIWSLSQLYVERLKAVEIVLLDIERASQSISSIELRLASSDDMPADEVALRRIHNELIDTQNEIQRCKGAFDQLNVSTNKVRRIVEKTRPKQATHADVTRIEEDVKNLYKRWDNCGTQLIERLRSCEACADLLRTYKKRMDSERSWLSQMTAKVNTLMTRQELEMATKIYETLAERKPSIEDTNAAGGRLIREAKIFDLKIKNYRDNLEDSHPSLDASAKRSRRTPGADIVAQELDQMNKEYSSLIDSVLQLLNQLQDDESKLQEKRAAIMEKFNLCEDGIQKLNSWLTDVEQNLANLGTVREQTEELKKQIKLCEEINKDLESHQRQVATTLDYSHVIAQQGADFMNKEDISRVLKSTDALKKRYESACDHSDRLLRRLTSSYEELNKFRTELSTFKKWLDSAQRSLVDKEKQLKAGKDMTESFRELTNDVIAHQADLRFISMASQRFIDEAKDYLSSLNEFRLTLPRRLGQIESSEFLLKSEVSEVSKDYYDLLDRVNTLNDRMSGLSDKQRHFAEAYEKASRWLNEAKRNAKRILDEQVAAEPRAIQDQLDKVRSLNSDVQSNGRLIDNAIHAGRSLLENLEQIGVSASERRPIEDNVKQLDSDYKDLVKNLSDRERKLDVALLQAGKFQDALAAVEKWLSDTEEMVANQKPLSADYNVVKAQLQEQKFLKKLILDRQNSMLSLANMGKDLMKNLDASERAPIERQLNDLTNRFDKLVTNCNDRMDALEQTLPIARAFAEKLGPLQEWLEASERKLIQLSSTIPTDQDRIRKRIAEHRALHQDIIAHKRDFEELTEIAQNLMSLVGDDEAQVVVDRLQEVTDKYAKLVEDSIALGQLLNESHEELGSFVLSFEDLLAWIQEMESRLSRFRVLSIFVDKLKEQLEELTELSEEINSHHKQVSDIVQSGKEIMKHSSGDDSIFIKEKLDSLQSKFSELTHKASDKLMQAREALPIAQNFHSAHNKLNAWMDDAERALKNLGSMNLNLQESTIQRLEAQIAEYRPLLETINHLGPQLGQISPGQGAATVEGFVTRATRRFDAICEQIQRKAERIQLSKQRNNEVIGDIEELLDWFRDAERQLLEAEPITPNPDALAILLKECKALNDDINSQKGRVRDVLTNAKKLMRESSGDDLSHVRDKAEDLKELANHVSQLCQDRLSALEQALPLAEHFFEAHADLTQWLDEAEAEVQLLGKPAIHASQIKRQQDRTEALLQSVAEHKPLVDRLNKTGAALMKLIYEEDARQVKQLIDSDNNRYNALRNILREQQNALEAALQATSQFADKLDGMLNALSNTADQLKNAEPIAAHPERIQEQILDNNAIINDLEKRAGAVDAIRSAAKDVILKAGKSDEPAIKEIKKKLNKLNDLWDEVQKNSKSRGRSLDDALKVAERFWDELNGVMKALRELQDTLNSQEPPAAEPSAIQQQQDTLQEIKQDIDHTKPEVDHCKQTGKNLMQLCGEPDKPEVKKHIEDLDNAWDNVTSLYAKREQNLIDAMEKAMNFHEILQNLLEFLDRAEEKFAGLGPIASDIDAVKKQIRELKDFKSEVDPHMIEIEALNRQAHELLERVSPDQARSIRGPLNEINRRWDDLLKGIVDRQSDLEHALLKLGQFQHALNEFLAWITKTEKTLDEMRPVFGDPQVIEVELAKHKVLMNDIHAHQTSVDTLNIAGKQLMASERGTENARVTQSKLNDLNSRWQQLQDKASQRQRELEEALKEAQLFNQEIQDLLMWLSDIDGQLVSSKPVGGLPETAREQLNRFMELYNELETNRPKVESVLQQGQDYLRRSTEGAATNLQHNLKTLKQRWDNVLNRANDRKIKLEIALREATEFHEALQEFVDWLTSAEKHLSNLQPVSRIVDNVLQQIEEHKHFQKDIGVHRETMLNLDKKGTHLKYFSQKQDVILIKNLLVSVQHRWERVVSKAAERTRSLDHGYKEAKEFSDAWTDLNSWLDEAEKTLASIQQMGNNPDVIKQMLSRHKEFQRALGAKQSTYDATIKLGRTLKEKAPKPDVPLLQEMLDELKNKWNSVCNKSVDRQRKLEEALLYSGQFKDAVQALIDWLDKAKKQLAMDQPVHGDLDTVTALVDQHKSFQEDLKSRSKNLHSVRKTATDLLQTANVEDARHIKEQMSILDSKWDEVSRLSEEKQRKLDDALRQAEQLHKAVHMLLEWLSDAEMKLRFAGPLPEDEATTRQQIAEHERFMREMSQQEKNKDSTISLAQEILQKCHPDALPVIRHWITIIQSRWEEVSAWAQQREQRLQDHLRSLRDIMELLEELLAWLIGAEASLLAAEAQPLPDDIHTLEHLIEDHQRFIDDMTRREPDVEKVAKAFSTKRQPTQQQPTKGGRDSRTRGLPPRTSTPTRGHVEPEIKHPRARELIEKWRIVWKLAMERMKRLQDKLNYNRELERIKNFDFDEWRRRFLGWMNNKKARIMDFFRKLDKDNDGKVTKADFIDGFLASKFPTSRLEMERVADIFDRNGDGYVDQREWLDTLRPDRDNQPKTESEIIQDEVQRQVAQCTCLNRYKVYQVGEGKYRFGESQKLRLVRILRSTVMVRVGGGWVSLDEFLVKNDPCRAKGRTNVELREQFILADGVSQSMTPFKSKSPLKDGNIPTTGPITKIREKSERSVPMGHQHHYRYGNSTSDYSFSDQADTSGSKSRPRSRLTIGSTGSKPNSRPGSRHSSRPPSRAGSDMSVESLEGYQQRRSTPTRSKLGVTVKRTSSIGRTSATTNGNGVRERWK